MSPYTTSSSNQLWRGDILAKNIYYVLMKQTPPSPVTVSIINGYIERGADQKYVIEELQMPLYRFLKTKGLGITSKRKEL